ncbi:MAG: DsbA family protein [Acidimicrobiia bacterium]|nr:DsbA family protein [Acidimicrobiia bacterium]
MTRFAITYDYLCPFSRIGNEAVVEALDDGADYDVTFRPFSLSQNHLEVGDQPVWEHDPAGDLPRGVRALLWSLAVRDGFPDSFRAFHVAVYNAKHDDLLEIGDASVLSQIAESVGLDAGEIAGQVSSGIPAKTLAAEHTDLVETHAVFGVPTFIADGEAVFVRFMERHQRADLDRVLGMLSWTNVNEFKRTRVDQ